MIFKEKENKLEKFFEIDKHWETLWNLKVDKKINELFNPIIANKLIKLSNDSIADRECKEYVLFINILYKLIFDEPKR